MKNLINLPKVLILKGLPASGKSTFAKRLLETESNWKRVNKDDLRLMIDPNWSQDKEDFIIKIRDQFILTALGEGFNVVVDDTNFGKHEGHIRNLVRGMADVEVTFFDVALEECVKRDSERSNSVGTKVIQDFYNKYPNQEPGNF